jgi:hypothetical protein
MMMVLVSLIVVLNFFWFGLLVKFAVKKVNGLEGWGEDRADADLKTMVENLEKEKKKAE